mmetsp:Transcript_87656/g.253152  ORF Transcript_87656/g.253152 Transcript_87656/m.253152 type:complete len:83 (-) Transcript_87656:1325-1573(-)
MNCDINTNTQTMKNSRIIPNLKILPKKWKKKKKIVPWRPWICIGCIAPVYYWYLPKPFCRTNCKRRNDGPIRPKCVKPLRIR